MPSTLPTEKNAALRVMQIIAGALMLGVASFAAVAALLMTRGDDAPRDMLLAPIAAGVSLLLLVVCAIVPVGAGGASGGAPAASAGGAGKADGAASKELALYGTFQTRMIVRYALLEGAAMFNLVATLIEKQPYSLAVAGLLLVVMGAMFPTRGRVEAFVRAQTELSDLADLRDR